MQEQTNKEAAQEKSQATSDVNLATYIKVVKKIDSCGHFFKGKQLFIQFPITEQEISQYKEEYINSVFSIYDATKRNYLRLLK